MKIFWLAFITLLVSCTKDNETEDQASKTDHITSAEWKYDNGGIDADKNGSIDLSFGSGIVPACVLDNTVTFNKDGSGIAEDGAVKCDVSIPEPTQFNWSFSNNETKLNILGSGVFGTGGQFDILILNENQLSLRKDTTMPGTQVPVWMVVELKH